MTKTRTIASLLFSAGCVVALPAHALSYSELEVYPYQTESKGEIEIENQTTYTAQGTKSDPAALNNKGLTRSSMELTYGLTDKTEVTAYLDVLKPQGGGVEYGGNRFRARTRFFEKGELPVDLGLYAEYEVPDGLNRTREVELRGIIEKDFGKFTFDINPIFEKAVRGPESANGFEFQYSASAIYRLNERYHPRLDLFGDIGVISHLDPDGQQKHLISPAVDVRLGKGLALTVGPAFGLTPATEKVLLRTQLELEFY